MIYPPSQEKAWIPGKDEKNIDENLPIELLEIQNINDKEET